MDKELREALSWINSVCAVVNEKHKRGDFQAVATLHPAVKTYFAECYLQRRMTDELFASLWPSATAAIVRIHAGETQPDSSAAPDSDLTGPLAIAEDAGFSTVTRPEDLQRWQEERRTLQAFMRKMGDLARLDDDALLGLMNELEQMLQRQQITGIKTAAAQFTPAEVQKMVDALKAEVERRKGEIPQTSQRTESAPLSDLDTMDAFQENLTSLIGGA